MEPPFFFDALELEARYSVIHRYIRIRVPDNRDSEEFLDILCFCPLTEPFHFIFHLVGYEPVEPRPRKRKAK
jgi:hypothetical protein